MEILITVEQTLPQLLVIIIMMVFAEMALLGGLSFYSLFGVTGEDMDMVMESLVELAQPVLVSQMVIF